MPGPLNRTAIVAAIGLFLLLTFWLNSGRLQTPSLGSTLGSISLHPGTTSKDGHLPLYTQQYFDQVFAEEPSVYDYPALREHCDRAEWRPELENVYIQCNGMFAGMTSIMSEVKGCFKMAIEAGTGMILPTIPLRDSTDLKEFNYLNQEAYMPYDQWWDGKHLKDALGRACPRMKILHPDQLSKDQADKITIKNEWEMDIFKAPGYHQFSSHFWTGNPFKTFFDTEFKKLQESSTTTGEGITTIKIAAIFLLFRITDDATGDDLAAWNEMAMLMRFLEKPRKIVKNLLTQAQGRPIYGVHFRAENDSVWNSAEDQMNKDLDALDKAYSLYASKDGLTSKPLVYLACGDEQQMKMFVSAGASRGWEVTHKWDLARQIKDDGGQTVKMINELAFDFQGAVDMGIMTKAHFFMGITGSAFSNTVAHARDATGRYRGSSLRENWDDGGARSHLFADGVASSYPCCL